MHRYHHLPPLSRRHSPSPLAGLPSPQAALHSNRRRRLRPKHHHPTADVDHRAVLRPHKEPEQACLHLLRQVLRLCLVQEPGHNAAGSAATPVPGEAQLGFGVPGDRRHAAPGVGGGFERVGDGRGLWGGGSEADISGQSAVEGWGHQNCALWALR